MCLNGEVLTKIGLLGPDLGGGRHEELHFSIPLFSNYAVLIIPFLKLVTPSILLIH